MSPGLISLSDVTSFSALKIFTSSMSEPHASSLFTIICKLPCELHPGSIKSSGRRLEMGAGWTLKFTLCSLVMQILRYCLGSGF